ncbi:hypothetical protein [Dactylosporangium sp. CA-233914]|uniref:hypothetical protein n=1 Tax=Dactylosporangium sp. CA-233914 TaxID=3239934 RepID=UPI003D91CF14
MRSRTKPVLVLSGVLVAALAACTANATSGPPPGGGLVTPSSVPFSVGPSAHTTGNSMPTGIVVNGKELILYFWGEPDHPYLAQASRSTTTGAIDVDDVCLGGRAMTKQLATVPGKFFFVGQCVAPDGLLIEYGAVYADAERITSRSGGTTYEAKFARWTPKPGVTVFWLHRKGDPIPGNVSNRPGETTPLPEEHYPLLTAYDAKGEVLATERIRPDATEQKGG